MCEKNALFCDSIMNLLCKFKMQTTLCPLARFSVKHGGKTHTGTRQPERCLCKSQTAQNISSVGVFRHEYSFFGSCLRKMHLQTPGLHGILWFALNVWSHFVNYWGYTFNLCKHIHALCMQMGDLGTGQGKMTLCVRLFLPEAPYSPNHMGF